MEASEAGDAATEAILLALRRIIRRVSLHSKQLARSSGLTLPQVVCLKILAARPDMEATIAGIGREARLSSATVTGIADRLERSGYVERVRGTEDRRRVYLRLTEAGRVKVGTLPTPLQESFVQRFGALPRAERETMLASLERIVALMEADDLDASPLLVHHEMDAAPSVKD